MLTKEDTNEAEAAPHEEHFRLQICVTGPRVDHVWCCVGNSPVQEPVGRSGHRQRLGSDLQWEDLASNDPGTWSPRAGEEEDVDAHEGDESLLTGQVIGTNTSADTSNNKLAYSHADSPHE